MKILSTIMKTSNWIFGVVVGAIGFFWVANFFDLSDVARLTTEINANNKSLRLILTLLAIYLVMFNVLYLLTNIFRRKYASTIKLNLSDGNLSIDISAIEDSLRRAVKKLKMRFQEIIEVKEPPIFTIILSDIIERDEKRSESRKKEKELAGRRMFYGPEYPIY
ncbi:MAG: hypothetical protein HY762_02235 [Planctomycetes bacterium]|nr:hypothetical protein [Planctomycetota bacterium]